MQRNDSDHLSPVRSVPVATAAQEVQNEESSVGDGGGDASTPSSRASGIGKRTVCDHCRRRRIRCDGHFPCRQCSNAALSCKREHVPKKRGPKRGHGRVINELRAREMGNSDPESANGSDIESDPFTTSATSVTPSPPHQPWISWIPWTSVTSDPRNAPEPKGKFTTDTLQPISRSYLHLMPKCVDLYYEHIYPIMPILYMPVIRTTLAGPMTPSEKNLVYSLCALTSFHMSGKSMSTPGPQSWETVGRFFLDECISVRQSYDFPEDTSLYAVISSFWISTSFFEINQNRKSWYYLREALTLAIDLRLQNDAANNGLPIEEQLCRLRVFWILFVTERSFAILRNKPLTLRKTPSLPKTKHSYEKPEIHAGFLKLVSSYVPLDESFVNAWNDGNDPRVSATTYLNLQHILSQPLDFLRRKSSTPPPALPSASTAHDEEPDPTLIQKADLLVTQQWLRLVVWQSSFRQGLLSTAAPDESFTFSFPLIIARDTVAVLQALPSRAVEVHGMGMFEKIFEIGTWCVNVMGAYDAGSNSPLRPFGGAMENRVAGMDFVGGELALLGSSGRGMASLDPLELFVKTLSASPNSKTMFADKLLMFAGETPGGMRTALSPSLSAPQGSLVQSTWAGGGTVVGEVTDGSDIDERGAGVGAVDANTDQMGNTALSTGGIRVDSDHCEGMSFQAQNNTTNTNTNNESGLGLFPSGSSAYGMANGSVSTGLSASAFSEGISSDVHGYGLEISSGSGAHGLGVYKSHSTGNEAYIGSPGISGYDPSRNFKTEDEGIRKEQNRVGPASLMGAW